MKIIQRRHCLIRMRQRIGEGELIVGFIGGSITDPRAGDNWPFAVIAWLVDQFPRVRIHVENAAIGATGSELAVFRAERDLIRRKCDVVFVEFAANDAIEPVEKRRRTFEGLVRKLRGEGGCDVILAYAFSPPMYPVMAAGGIPDTIREMDEVGEHYGLSSVWMGRHALNDVAAGRLRWEEWLPDGLHPESRGSQSYARPVIELLEAELAQPSTEPSQSDRSRPLPTPLNAANWERAHVLPLGGVVTRGPWVTRRWAGLVWIDQVLETTAPGAQLSLQFHGRGLSVGFEFGPTTGDFRHRLDGGPWQLKKLPRPRWKERPPWARFEGRFEIFHVADDLPVGPHIWELEVLLSDQPDAGGSTFRLALVGCVP